MEKKFGATTVVKLLKLCNVASIAELPPIYPQWSGEPKAQHLESLQTALDEEKQECKEDGLQLITTAALLTNEHGDEEQAMTAQSTYKICHNEGGTPSLTDAQEMIQPSAEAPVALFQVRQQALRQMIYVAVLQGRNHPLVNALAACSLQLALWFHGRKASSHDGIKTTTSILAHEEVVYVLVHVVCKSASAATSVPSPQLH